MMDSNPGSSESRDYEFPASRLLVFCKAPVAGKVKTRLIPALGEPAATALHCELASRVMSMCEASRLAPVELWCGLDIRHPFFDAFVGSRHAQHGEDLGMRMANAFAATLARPGVDSVVLIGTDCVNLDEAYLREALVQLSQYPAVLGPAEDGGYGLIGLTRLESDLFQGIDWGTDTVCASTARKMNATFDHWRLLSLLWDVDRPEDVQRYQQLQQDKGRGQSSPV